MSFRFSLRQLLVVIALAAVACAALARPSYWWHSAIVTATVIAMIAMAIAACVGRERTRAYAAGWLVFAVGYLAIMLGPWSGQQFGPQLLTSKSLALLESVWHRDQPSPPVFGQPIADYDGDGTIDLWVSQPRYYIGQPAGGSGAILWNVNTGMMMQSPVNFASSQLSLFQATGHWLLASILGHVGGLFALVLATTRTSGK